jgi:uncharacterized protein YhbP (UPF0306 family)
MEMNYKSYEDKAESIIKHNMYMSISTCDMENKPWVATVFYVHDKNYNFYFLSAVDSRHAKDLLANPNVAFSIFNSGQPIGISDGVQGEGVASLVDLKDIKKIIELYAEKAFPKSTITPTMRYNPEYFSGDAEFRFFKITVFKLFTTGPERRVEVDLVKKRE